MSLPILDNPTVFEKDYLREAAKTEDGVDCVSWHKHCKSECCSQFSLEDKGQDLSQKVIRIYGNALPDIIRYYKLHGVKYRMPWLYIPTKNAVRHNGRIFILNRCEALLDNGRCAFHGTNLKPKVCRELTFESVKKGLYYGGAKVTPRCLFAFKETKEE